jgi:opacity protein-like surface antigen
MQALKTALYSAAVGYNPSDLYSVDVEYIYRPNYTYEKYQTSTAVDTIKFNGNKTRYFNLQSNSLMANLYLHGSNYARTFWQDFRIQPFIGAGIGVGFNKVSNFHSEKDPAVGDYIVAVEQDRLRSSLAWQLSAGLEILSCNYLNLDAGYRYYNGGTYNSNNYVINTQDYGTPLSGVISANEFFVRLSKTFG